MKVKDLLISLSDCDSDADVYFVCKYTNPIDNDEVEVVESVYEIVERGCTDEPCAGVYLRGGN